MAILNHQEYFNSESQKALTEAAAFNKKFKVADTLLVLDSFGIVIKATVISPARVLNTKAVVGIKEHPGCIFLKDVLEVLL